MNLYKVVSSAKSVVDEMDIHEEKKQRIFIRIKLTNTEIIEALRAFDRLEPKLVDGVILDLIESILIHTKTIYDTGKYTLPYHDEFYDSILSKFKKFRDEPFANNTIGLAVVDYKYETLSGTLDKAHWIYDEDREESDNRDTVEEWIKSLDCKNLDILVNQKKDGTSVAVDFKLDDNKYRANGAVSRGKKDYGEGSDVSPVSEGLSFKANKLEKVLGFLPKSIGIQYELVVSDTQKEKLEDHLGMKFANNRTAAISLMRRLVFSKKGERKSLQKFMSLVPVGFEIKEKHIKKDIKNLDICIENIKILDELCQNMFNDGQVEINDISWDKIYHAVCETFIYGDVTMDYTTIEGDKKHVLKEFSKLAARQLEKRDDLNHDIDGLVITILNKSLRKKLGRTNGINKFQIAYKFPEQARKTKVLGLIVTTGNFGYKELLAEVEPVELNGTIQNKGQIHSLAKFKDFDLRVGDEVYLKLSGDVIPYMYKDSDCRKGSGPKLKLPDQCECGTELVEEKNKLRCSNPDCEFRIIGSLVTFLKEVNAKGIGVETCKDIYEELHVTKPSQMLKLEKKDFLKLDGFQEDSAKLCMNTIKDIRERPRTEAVVLSSLGIDSFRASTAEKVLEVIKLDEMIELAEKEKHGKLKDRIKESSGVDANASKIAAGLIEKVDELKDLLDLMTVKKKKKNDADKVILISGIRNDEELEEVAERNGYKIKDSGKNFDLLVIKDDSYRGKTKGKLANKLNKQIMTRKEFMKKFN